MRISLLLEREPFGRILEETLPPLLSALSGRPHAVRWQGHGRVDGARGGYATAAIALKASAKAV